MLAATSTREFDRVAGWLALAVAGSGTPAGDWREQVSDLMFARGWRTDRRSDGGPDPALFSFPLARSLT